MKIIQHVLQKFLLVVEKIIELLDGKCTYPEFEAELEKLLNDLGREICTEVLHELDQNIYKDKHQRKNWVVIQKDCQRTVTTVFGDITYERRYYKNKETGETAYLTDKAAGIQKYERIDAALKADITDLSTILSYQKSTQELKRDGASCNVSRQTVMNTLRKIDNLQTYEKPKMKKKIETLYIEADEDHIHLQNGKAGMVKLIYVHEGKQTITKGRNEIKNPIYFSGVYDKEKIEDLWKEVWMYITNTYDEDKIKRIYISGDGAEWIKFGVKYLPNAIYVLDFFHLQKYITAALKNDKKTKRALWKAIFKTDRQKVNELLTQKYNELGLKNPENIVTKCQTYINNNWDGICSYSLYKNEIVGCSAESHVSHVLSERLSRGPIAWSKVGAHKMAKLRAIKASGISLKDAILKQQYEGLKPLELPKQTVYKAKQQLKKIKSTYENIISLPILQNKKTLTSQAIKSLLLRSAI
ncbi:ISLre2 family transposase [Thermoanaerobacterium thermosaccharolyticum]|uniref:ISLre2 family transposase n=1 Tax=Thermoanaerobacterium thermosaccharolyticum TaxID=1517 RepID=UPI003D2BA81C